MNTQVLNNINHHANQQWLTLKQWLQTKSVNVVASFFGWALQQHKIQVAIANHIRCGGPIMQALEEHFSDRESVDAESVDGLESFVEHEIERALEGFEIDAENIRGLDQEMAKAIEDAADEVKNEAVEAALEELRDRLK